MLTSPSVTSLLSITLLAKSRPVSSLTSSKRVSLLMLKLPLLFPSRLALLSRLVLTTHKMVSLVNLSSTRLRTLFLLPLLLVLKVSLPVLVPSLTLRRLRQVLTPPSTSLLNMRMVT